MTWIFGSFLVTPSALTSCHAVISEQGDGSVSVQTSDMRTTRSDFDRVPRIESWAGTRSRPEALGRPWRYGLQRGASVGKRWHPLAPGRRYGTRRSLLYEYMSFHLSFKLTTNCGLLSRIKWDIFYKEVFRSFIEFRKSCRWTQVRS